MAIPKIVDPIKDPPPEPVQSPDSETPLVSSENLTPEQQRIRQLEDQLARVQGNKDVDPEYEDPTDSEDAITIHILRDGFTFNGIVAYRGQEFTFVPGTRPYEDTKNKHGRSWLSLRSDPGAQYDRWNHQYFADGPWPFSKSLKGTKFEVLKKIGGDGFEPTPTVEELERAERAEASRKRAAPKIASM